VMYDHKIGDDSKVDPEAHQASRQLVPGAFTGQHTDQQKKLAAARELLLEVATFHDDCLEKIKDSMESLTAKMHHMDIAIQTGHFGELEDKPRAAPPKSQQMSRGNILSSFSSDNVQDLPTLITCAKGTTDKSPDKLEAKSRIEARSTASQTNPLHVEEFAAECNIQSTIQRVEQMDKKLERFFMAMMVNTRREIQDLELTLRTVIHNHLGSSRSSVNVHC